MGLPELREAVRHHRRVAGISAVPDWGMSLAFWLKEKIDSPRFDKIEHYGGNDWG